MDLMLLALTALSLVAALTFGVVAWRLAREERGRSQARIAALSMAADVEAPIAVPPAAHASPATGQDAEELPPTWTFPARVAPRVASRARAQELARRAEPLLELSIVPDAARAAGVGDTFLRGASDAAPADGRQRTLAMAAAALLVAMIGGFAWTYVASSRQPAPGVVGAGTAPLELVALRHERQGPTLAVSGTVRNPAGGQPVDDVSAVVQLFDQTGAVVTRGQAQIDFLKLGPGDESPFVIAIAAPPNVARYRVSFTTTGGVMPHVDRRTEPPASSPAPTAARASAPGE